MRGIVEVRCTCHDRSPSDITKTSISLHDNNQRTTSSQTLRAWQNRHKSSGDIIESCLWTSAAKMLQRRMVGQYKKISSSPIIPSKGTDKKDSITRPEYPPLFPLNKTNYIQLYIPSKIWPLPQVYWSIVIHQLTNPTFPPALERRRSRHGRRGDGSPPWRPRENQ